MRKIHVYAPHGPDKGGDLPIDAPTMATRRLYGTGAFKGLINRWNGQRAVPIEKPVTGQGATFPAFPFVTPSSVAPDAINPSISVAINDFSPIGHRSVLTESEFRATKPTRKQPGVQTGRRGTGGHYTIPSPLTTAQWPTSSQWIAGRINAGLRP